MQYTVCFFHLINMTDFCGWNLRSLDWQNSCSTGVRRRFVMDAIKETNSTFCMSVFMHCAMEQQYYYCCPLWEPWELQPMEWISRRAQVMLLNVLWVTICGLHNLFFGWMSWFEDYNSAVGDPFQSYLLRPRIMPCRSHGAGLRFPCFRPTQGASVN